jgi:hypothetical protein
MTDLYIYPDCHLSAPIKETIALEHFDLVLLTNGEYCLIYPSGVIYTNLRQKEVDGLLERKNQ